MSNERCVVCRPVRMDNKGEVILILQILVWIYTLETYRPSRRAKGFLLATDMFDGALCGRSLFAVRVVEQGAGAEETALPANKHDEPTPAVDGTPALSRHRQPRGPVSSHSECAVQFMAAHKRIRAYACLT